ncbi:hypothetical protein TEA_017204 [Camellia sinensis var. sinensis]|uniref:Uncharacterized protein n=1 Tax=Camellia sinensis var. sinensis TaxID=542762 RepID=A0A4S4ENI7_CAMSN|nr:hypothetical protein TEA_017204 [Camellia sinensis var. sinensis]
MSDLIGERLRQHDCIKVQKCGTLKAFLVKQALDGNNSVAFVLSQSSFSHLLVHIDDVFLQYWFCFVAQLCHGWDWYAHSVIVDAIDRSLSWLLIYVLFRAVLASELYIRSCSGAYDRR